MTTFDAAATTSKKPGPHLAIAIAVIILGTIMGIGGIAKGVSSVVHDVKGIATSIAPSDIQRHLDSGTWEIYAGDQSNGLQPSDVTVTAADGSVIPVRGPGGTTETLTSGGRSYVGQVQFTISHGGEYEIKVDGPPGTPILVSKSLGDLAKHAAGWFILMAAGILVGIVGVVLLIIGIVRRSRAKRGPMPATGSYPAAGYPTGAYLGTPQPSASPAAGWYPDASIPGTMRWWDGTKWTDQTHAQ